MRIHKEGFLVIAVAFLIWLSLNFAVGMTEELYFRCFTFLATTPVLVLVLRFFHQIL